MSSRQLIRQVLGLILALTVLTGCGIVQAEPTSTPTPTLTPTPAPTPTPTTGTITGMILDGDGQPLGNISDEEIMVVALFCSNDDPDVECFHEDFWDMKTEALFNSICEADNTASNCLLHLGRGAASVEADGSFTIDSVPPGKYGLVFLLNGPGLIQVSIKRDVASVRAGEITEYDFATDLRRK